MMTNNTIKNKIREMFAAKEIIINKITLKGVEKTEEQIIITQVILSFDSIDGIMIDDVVSCLNDVESKYNINISNKLLDI